MNAEPQRKLADAKQLAATGRGEEAIDALVEAAEKFPTVGPIFAMLVPMAAAALRWDIAGEAARQAIWLNESRPAGAVFPAIMPFTALTLDLDPR